MNYAPIASVWSKGLMDIRANYLSYQLDVLELYMMVKLGITRWIGRPPKKIKRIFVEILNQALKKPLYSSY